MTTQELEQQRMVAGVRFTKVGKLYHFDYSAFPEIQPGDYVIVETLRGRQMGQVMGFAVADDGREHKPIMRPATPRDLVLKQHWEAKEPEAIVICREKASQMGNFEDVKFVAAQYNYDGSNLTFLFSAEQKVNTNRLWNELRRVFPDTQVDMRQIGPRDVAKLLGGYGACGELRCCSTFLTDFSPISIKMAKVQGISLNPSEITGMCGRLRCCLVYEYEQYVEARKQLPKKNKRVGTPKGAGKVIDVHPLTDSVTVWIDEEGRHSFKREELIPLEELEALQKKASEPCNKHGDEPCSCGQKPGTRNQDWVSEATEAVADAPVEATAETPVTAQAPEGDAKPEARGGKSSRGRNRGKKRSGGPANNDNKGGGSSEGKPAKSKRSRGKKRSGKSRGPKRDGGESGGSSEGNNG